MNSIQFRASSAQMQTYLGNTAPLHKNAFKFSGDDKSSIRELTDLDPIQDFLGKDPIKDQKLVQLANSLPPYLKENFYIGNLDLTQPWDRELVTKLLQNLSKLSKDRRPFTKLLQKFSKSPRDSDLQPITFDLTVRPNKTLVLFVNDFQAVNFQNAKELQLNPELIALAMTAFLKAFLSAKSSNKQS